MSKNAIIIAAAAQAVKISKDMPNTINGCHKGVGIPAKGRSFAVVFFVYTEVLMRKSNVVRKIVFSGLMLAVAFLLPFLTGQIPQIGSMLLPMHLPVLICGFACGWPWGLAVGLIAPLFRSLIMTMPPMFPTAIAMAFEMAAYGAVCGLLYQKFPKKNLLIYAELIIAMIIGRIVWGTVSFVLISASGGAFTFEAFMAGALLNAVPGIILQIVLVPPIIMLLKKAGFIAND